MSDATTTNRGYPYPNGKDFIPNGPVEMEAIVNALDEENRGEIDHLQAGVTLSTDWGFTAALESTSECKLESAATTGGVCWLPLTAIGLVRSVTTAAKIKALKPSSLPAAGKYMTVGFELTPSISDGAATVSVVAGTEEATQKSAEEHVPATTAGKVRIRNIVILNTAGTYSIAAQTDVRPWCTGGTVAETKEEGKVGPGTINSSKVAASLTLTATQKAEAEAAVWQSGDLKLSAAASPASGWLKCEGQEVSRSTYAALFAAIGTTYGEGNKSTTFNLPNYVERVPMGPGSTNKLGAKLGASTVTLTAAQSGLREHGHEMFSEEAGGAAPEVEEGKVVGDTSGGGSDKGLANNYTGAFKFRIGVKAAPAENAAESHTNIQPSTVCNVWIKT